MGTSPVARTIIILGGNLMNEGSSLIGSFLGTVQTDVMGSLGTALPLAATVFAAIAGVMVGIKFFKKITGVRA